MIPVVADTSPLNYLLLIGAIRVLPELFNPIFVPPHVWNEELRRDKTPSMVKRWVENPPAWISVRSPAKLLPGAMHRGEREAISLAKEIGCPALLDDGEARAAAAANGVVAIGTLGVIDRAGRMGLIDVPTALVLLSETNARLDRALLTHLLSQHSRR